MGRPQRPPGGLRQHPADRRALRRRVHRGQRHLHAALPGPRGRGRELLVRQGGREGAALPLPRRHPRRGPQAGRLRGRRHHRDGLPGLLPRRRRLHQLGQGQRHPRRPRPWLGCGLDVRLRDAHHRPRPAQARPDLRALPQPRPRLDARLRHRLRRASARRGDPLRLRQVRRRPGLDDRHLRHHQGQAGGQGLLAHPRLPLRDGRPDHQGDAGRRDGQGRPAQGDLRPGAQALQRGRRVPAALRRRQRRQDGRRHRHRHRGPQAPVGRPRGRRDHVQRAAARRDPGDAPPGRRRGDHAVRLPDLREARPDQDGLPRVAQPDGPRRRADQHRVQPRREGRARGARADRRGRPTALLQRGDTLGVFQLDGGPMRALLRSMQPDTFEDISAVGALYRPGPMGADSHNKYARRKTGREAGRAAAPRARRGARGGAGRDLRADRLPGAGDGDRPAAGRLHAGPGRPAAARHGQEEEGGAGQAVRDLLRPA